MSDTISRESAVMLFLETNRIGGFHRKPTSWGEVGLPAPQSLLERLKQFSASDLGIEHDITAPFKHAPEDTVFLVGYKGGLYLVRTEGFDYACYVRYIGQTFDKPVPDTLEYVLQAFDNNGYNMRGPKDGMPDTDGLKTATFIGVSTTGKEMYRVTYKDPNGLPDSGVAYVWEESGKKIADF
jgi:hypothetical protein